MRSLTERLVELLQENESNMIRMSILLLRYLLLDNGAPIPTPIALELAEELLPLFDHDDIQVQLSSMCFFHEMLDLLTKDGRKALKSHVRQCLVPLSFHCHDENQIVAEASRKTLHSAARFLKRRDFQQMLQVDQTWRFGEGLGCAARGGRGRAQAAPGPGAEPAPTLPSCRSLQLAEDRSRAAEHLRQALRYLESPQEPLREAAVRFMGMAGRHLRGNIEDLQVICEALEEMAYDSSPAVRKLATEAGFVLRAVQRAPYPTWRKLRDQFCSAWKKRPRLCHGALLCCWSSVER
ncbi:uncharacterized protein LOC141730418 [Zonotrichia albicollis]|uniref:uncharacterized protein LOC141730418 n=1 Tax=Zonotrichia albicollis TaxID=44394 RepID=UPI003D80E448